jgi:hypothetical protein
MAKVYGGRWQIIDGPRLGGGGQTEVYRVRDVTGQREGEYPAARFCIEPIDERFEKIGTYEIYRVDCNLVNGIPPRYRDDR